MKLPTITAHLLTLTQHSMGNLEAGSQSLAPPSPFSSGFKQPAPPKVKAEFRASWNQHQWSVNVSRISAGFLYNSVAQQKVRADAAADTELFSSLFDYTNITPEGVASRMWTLSPSINSAPQIWEGFVNPVFPLVSEDILIENNAVYQGPVADDKFVGAGEGVIAWDMLYQGSIPTTVLVDGEGVIQGYDFWSPGDRTRVVTRFFNIILGDIGNEVFDFPIQSSAML